jgi:CheY-like chemotaxis protein
MEPLSLLTAAVAFVGAEVAKKAGGAVAEQAYQRLMALLRRALGHDPKPEELTAEVLGKAGVSDAGEVAKVAREVFARSPALRRAERAGLALRGKRVLWVDDYPHNNVYECRALGALGIEVEQVTTTLDGLTRALAGGYDLVLSDIAREWPDDGLELLRRMRQAGCDTPVVFYVGKADPRRGVPARAEGIADSPEPLFDLVFGVLEQKR